MLSTQRGNPDGIHTQVFEKGRTYTEEQMGKSLMRGFLFAGMAEEVVPMNKKAIGSAPHKQAVAVAPDNKGQSTGMKRATSKG
uniref:Uncharacterized protein n=1 Tax=viral metagenome TaxID=1070528 RepID=A0A6M3ITY0_9ZZZZ